MIVGAYGRKFNVKPSEHEPSDCIKDRNFNDLSSMFEVQMGDEAYIEFLLEHCDLDVDDLLYCCFEGDELKGTDGVEFHSPPVFILRDRVKQTIVVLIRGTQNLNDVIVDVYGNSMRWEEGAVHEGMGMIARWVATDNIIVSTIEDALINNVNYSLTVVGHSLGASIAALTTIYWKNHKTFRKFERSYKNGQFLQCFAFAPAPMLSRQIKEKGLGFVVSIVNEDDVVPRLSKNGILDTIQLVGVMMMVYVQIIGNCKEKSWFKRMKSSASEHAQSLFGKNNTLLQLYLPGTVYYLHPCMDHYEEYEKTKRILGDVGFGLIIDYQKELSLVNRMKVLHDKVEGIPGASIFVKGMQFPGSIILSPMVLIHHFVFNYEDILKNVYNAVKQEE